MFKKIYCIMCIKTDVQAEYHNIFVIFWFCRKRDRICPYARSVLIENTQPDPKKAKNYTAPTGSGSATLVFAEVAPLPLSCFHI